VDPDGRLLVGSMPIDMPAGAGQLWSLEYDGSAILRRQGLTCPNGLAWINGGAQLVAIDSPERCIQIFTYDRETGSIGAEIRRIDCSEFTGVPDGCCLDRNGGLWVAFWGGGCVRRFDLSDDSVSEQIACPTSQITACAFVGPERDRLLITSAAIDLDEPQAGHCFVCDLGNTAYRGDDAQAWAGPIP
jgi:sugar lactone lactonase YvrE